MRPSAASLLLLTGIALASAYTQHHNAFGRTRALVLSSSARIIPRLQATARGTDEEATCWNPRLRKVMGIIAGAGVLETSYLTYTDFAGNTANLLCSEEAASCTTVLTGPYSHLPGTEIPLAALGLLAYSAVVGLAVGPMLSRDDRDDANNRVALTAVTTTMGTFSVFLMAILVGVLHEFCPYCVVSAVFSIVLAKLAWLGGALPNDHTKEGVGLSAAGALLSLAAAVFLVTGNDHPATAAVNVAGELVGAGPVTTVLAESKQRQLELQAPPRVTTDSSETALALAEDLQSLDATFYGAFWCSHCFDQKQALGKQAMARIPYVECSKEGVDAQVTLCKDKKVPGYPTWEINGKLYPGEQALEELQDIVAAAKAAKRS